MTRTSTKRADGPVLRFAAAAALVVASACAAPILATGMQGAAPGGETGAAGPVSCGVATESRAGMTTFRPWVRLDRPRTGSFHFALSGGGTVLDQGGGLELGPDGQSVLGEATVTGPATAYDIEMSVEVEGTRYRCNVHPQDI